MARQPHEQRVVDERQELFDKHQKLEAFVNEGGIFETLPQRDQELLRRQYSVMEDYLDILNERIERFPNDPRTELERRADEEAESARMRPEVLDPEAR